MMAIKLRKGKKILPTVKLSSELLDEIEEVIYSRHPEKETRAIEILEKAFNAVLEAHRLLRKVNY